MYGYIQRMLMNRIRYYLLIPSCVLLIIIVNSQSQAGYCQAYVELGWLRNRKTTEYGRKSDDKLELKCMLKNEQSDSADPSAKASPDLDDLQNLLGLPCPVINLQQNFHEDPIMFSRGMSQIVEKCLVLPC